MLAEAQMVRVCGVDDVPPLEGRNVTVAGRKIAVFNSARGFRALAAACPHKAGPLADGILADACVVCPLHNWRIDLDSGQVVSGGEGSVASYEVTVEDGSVFIAVDWEIGGDDR